MLLQTEPRITTGSDPAAAPVVSVVVDVGCAAAVGPRATCRRAAGLPIRKHVVPGGPLRLLTARLSGLALLCELPVRACHLRQSTEAVDERVVAKVFTSRVDGRVLTCLADRRPVSVRPGLRNVVQRAQRRHGHDPA